MTYGKRFANYDRTSVETAGKVELVIMCYDKAIQCLAQSKAHYKSQDYELKARKLQKALNIVNELQGCLDLEKGGQIAKNLDAIYTYVTQRLLIGDIKGNFAIFDEIIYILGELKEAWQGISSKDENHISDMATTDSLRVGMAQVAA